ncbi:MAG: hypothetical protein HYS27_22925 [Deltaproteobacteria bacterium]|nr:hypothetical protein [Deltaproteobacteria bacterium]
MSDANPPIHLPAEPIEGRRSVELVRDEDVLSLDLQHALEQVGTGVGLIAVAALLFSQLPRAGRFLASMRAAPTPPAGTGEPS